MNRHEIITYYENQIDDIKDEEVREKLYKELQTIEDILIVLDGTIDEELEYQEDHLPSQEEEYYDYEYSRKENVL